MKVKLYSIYDVKAEAFNHPYTAINDQMAMRNVQMELNNEKSIMRQFPADYKLYCVGELEDRDGIIQPENPARLVCEVNSLVKKEVD